MTDQQYIEQHLTFERIGNPDSSLGTALVARWDNELIFETTALRGRRKKFIVRSSAYGPLIVKAHPVFRPGKLVTEGDVWENLPDELLPHFEAPIAAGVFDVEAPQPGGRTATEHVHYVVQHLVTGTDNVSFLDFKARLVAAEAAGFVCHDANPGQLRTRPDGSIVWLDFELWEYRSK